FAAIPECKKTMPGGRGATTIISGGTVPRGRTAMTPTRLTTALKHIRRLAGAPDPLEQSDAQLLQRYLGDRDEAAFAALVRRHGPMVLGVCRHVLRHRHDAEDAFQ